MPKSKNAVVVNDGVAIAPKEVDSIKTVHDSAGDAAEQIHFMDCDEALNQIFQTSDYKPSKGTKLSEYKIHIDEVGDTGFGLRVFYTHKGGTDSALIGLLNLDLQDGQLVDMSAQLDSSIELKYDSSLLYVLRKQCGH